MDLTEEIKKRKESIHNLIAKETALIIQIRELKAEVKKLESLESKFKEIADKQT